jgi:hypothetical protein
LARFLLPWWAFIAPTLRVLPFVLLLFGRASRRRNSWGLTLGVLGLLGDVAFTAWGVWARGG